MATPTCTAAALVLGCYNWERWTPHDQQALLVYLMAQELKGVGGTDYTTNLTGVSAGGLIGDSAAFIRMTQDQRTAALINIYVNNCTGAGGTVPATQAAAASAVSCLANATDDQLDLAFLWLTCKLGKHTGTV